LKKSLPTSRSRLRERLASLEHAESPDDRLELIGELNELKQMLDAELGIHDTQQTVAFSIAAALTNAAG